MKFTKMQACGNDYIYIDCFEEKFDIDVPKLCDRHFGIGADGVVLIIPCKTADCEMKMYNKDGSEGRMCGNALRCVARYMYDRRYAEKTVTVKTASGIRKAYVFKKSVSVEMGKPEISKDGTVNVGNLHRVFFCPDVDKFELVGEKDRNIEAVRIISDHEIEMRVCEIGSGKTLSCASGACASVAAAVYSGLLRCDVPICVRTLGGKLFVTYRFDTSILLTGDAEYVFDGVML